MTTTNQEVKTGVFYVLDSKFDVVFDGQETRRLFVLNIGFLWVYSGEISGVYGGKVWGNRGGRLTGTRTGIFPVVENGKR